MDFFSGIGKLSKFTIKFIVVLICGIILVVFLHELNNILTSSEELAQMSRSIMTQSAIYASQESYRGSGTADSQGNLNTLGTIAKGNVYSIYSTWDADNVVVTGKFYDGDTEQEAYTQLFTSNNFHEYLDWLESVLPTTYKSDNNYKMLKDIATNGTSSQYFKYFITPLNMGFTYIDPDVLCKIFKWYFTNKLTATGIQISRNGADYRKRSTIYIDKEGNPFIRWKGWRIYIQETSVDVSPFDRCKLLNLNDDTDKEMFEEYTGILVEDYFKDIKVQDNATNIGNKIQNNDIRTCKILYDIRWKMTIAYEGILPIAIVNNLLNFSGNSSAITSDWGDNTIILNTSIKNDIINYNAYKDKDSVFVNNKYNEIFFDKFNFTNMDEEHSLGNYLDDVNVSHYYNRIGNSEEGGNNLFNASLNTDSKTFTKETYGLAQNLHYCVVH